MVGLLCLRDRHKFGHLLGSGAKSGCAMYPSSNVSINCLLKLSDLSGQAVESTVVTTD